MFCLRARVNDASDYQRGVRLSTEKNLRRRYRGLWGVYTPNNSKSWSKLVKMENIWLKLVKVAARSNLAKVCQSLRTKLVKFGQSLS
jgi:hypothetical protein